MNVDMTSSHIPPNDIIRSSHNTIQLMLVNFDMKEDIYREQTHHLLCSLYAVDRAELLSVCSLQFVILLGKCQS